MQPYLRSSEVFQCPSAAKRARRTTDYFLNSRLAGLEPKAIPFPARTVLQGDGLDDSALHFALSHLPQGWRGDETSPALRHTGNRGANYAFADGHVKWLRPEKVTSQTPESSGFTFARR